MNTYSEFRLRIDRGPSTGTYRVVATGPSGEALGRFKSPFSDMELELFVLKVGQTRKGKRRIESPEMERAKDFGSRLFKSLFEGDVKELYSSSLRDAREENKGLRITLSLTGAPELSQIPWEYLYERPSFLSISTWTPIVRYLDIPKPRRPLKVTLPLRILGMVSAPSDTEPIDVVAEKAKLGQALAPLVESGWLAIDWLEKATLPALQRQLRQAEYHILHYIGHGGYDRDADDGVLLFEDEHGGPTQITGVQLGTILQDEISLRLAVLNACEGGRSSVEDPFSGVATSLIEFGIPAVIGMQFEITDRSAIVFASEFYSALADGYPVDSALAEARKAIYADRNDVEWATPVLFMRVQDGLLFEVPEHASARDQKPDPSGAVAAAKRLANEERQRIAAEEEAEKERQRVAAEKEAAEKERQRVAAEEEAAEKERQRVAAEEEAAEKERQRVAAEEAAAEKERQRDRGRGGRSREGTPTGRGRGGRSREGTPTDRGRGGRSREGTPTDRGRGGRSREGTPTDRGRGGSPGRLDGGAAGAEPGRRYRPRLPRRPHPRCGVRRALHPQKQRTPERYTVLRLGLVVERGHRHCADHVDRWPARRAFRSVVACTRERRVEMARRPDPWPHPWAVVLPDRVLRARDGRIGEPRHEPYRCGQRPRVPRRRGIGGPPIGTRAFGFELTIRARRGSAGRAKTGSTGWCHRFDLTPGIRFSHTKVA